jgi:hypothetical protein
MEHSYFGATPWNWTHTILDSVAIAAGIKVFNDVYEDLKARVKRC